MARTRIFDALFRTPARRRTLIYWQTVPLHRLWPLLLAIFCLFGIIGFIVDLFSLGQKPVVTVVVWSLFTGIVAVSYLLVLTRKPQLIFIPIFAHLLGSRLIAASVHHLGDLQHPPIDSGVKFAALSILGLSLAACAFFFLFIQGEGRHSVRMQTELSLAHGIQQTLVPTIDTCYSDYEIYGVSLPSDKVGGDLVDFVPLPNGSAFAYVADIAGHGLSAGILMGMMKTAVRTQLLDLPETNLVLERLNQVLPQVKEPHMYATCAALRLNVNGSSGRVQYAIAGHPPLLHASAATQTVTLLADEQLPIGLLPVAEYRTHETCLAPNDVLLVATDGILEAEDKKAQPFGLERLQQVLLDSLHQPLPAIAVALNSAIRKYQQTDDQTVLLVRYKAVHS